MVGLATAVSPLESMTSSAFRTFQCGRRLDKRIKDNSLEVFV